MTLDIYYYKKPIKATYVGETFNMFNLSMTNKQIKIQKNVSNRIYFSIKDLDNKPVKLLGRTLNINIIDAKNKRIIFKKPLSSVDEQTGRYELLIDNNDSSNWETLGFYQYSLSIIDEYQEENLLYTDLNASQYGVFEVADEAYPDFRNSNEITEFYDMPSPTNVMAPPYKKYTSNVIGNTQNGGSDILTVAVYMTNFTGKFWIQGTLMSNPGESFQLNNWFYINLGNDDMSTSYSEFTGIKNYNIEMQMTWTRFIWLEDINNEGTFDKILVRN